MESLKGMWALVTGSSRGIGQQIAYALAKQGCNLIIHGRRKDNTKNTLEMINDFPVEKRVVGAELNSDAGVQSLIDQIVAFGIEPDIIFNNAGIQNAWKEAFEFTMDEWRDIFEINTFSIVKINSCFIPKMIAKGKGFVINTSTGIADIPQMTPYAASKSAIDKYTVDIIPALEGTGVSMNLLDPGWLRTDLGGPDGEHAVETVIPGALAPLFKSSNIKNGATYHAHDYMNLFG